MADVRKLLELGEQMEYKGKELQEFVAKQQELRREERRREGEADKRRVEEEADKRRMEEDTEKRRFQHEQEAKEAEHRREMERLKLQVDQERWKAEQERKAYAEADAYYGLPTNTQDNDLRENLKPFRKQQAFISFSRPSSRNQVCVRQVSCQVCMRQMSIGLYVHATYSSSSPIVKLSTNYTHD